MRATWNGLSWLALMLAMAGCRSYEPHLRPPKNPEEFNPPPNEERYQKPPRYPADTMNQGLPKSIEPERPTPSGPRMGGRPGAPGGF